MRAGKQCLHVCMCVCENLSMGELRPGALCCMNAQYISEWSVVLHRAAVMPCVYALVNAAQEFSTTHCSESLISH